MSPFPAKTWRIVSIFFTFVCGFVLLGSLFWFTVVSQAAAAWQYPDRNYRVEISVGTGAFPRAEHTAELEVNFATLLSNIGEAGSFDEDSLAMTEVGSDDSTLNAAVSFQFDNGLPSGSDTASGTLVWLLDGTTAANMTRTFHIYFDAAGAFAAPAAFTERVGVSETADYRGQASYQFIISDSNGMQAGSYFYHRTGGGFASLFDADGNDWISYYDTVDSRSKGEFRGLPNLGDVFHPGHDGLAGSSDQGSTTTLVDEGPLKATIRSISFDNEYEAVWEIYPDQLRMTLINHPVDTPYWVLYEGTPGGDYGGGSLADSIVESDGSEGTAAWAQDLDPEWAFINDKVLTRSLYFAHINATDVMTDFFRRQNDNGGVAPPESIDNGHMMILGFGRDDRDPLLTENGVEFVVGFVESDTFSAVSEIVNGVINPLLITMGSVEEQASFPVVTVNAGVLVDEGETAVIGNTTLYGTIGTTFTLTSPPANGSLLLNGTPLVQDDVFVLSDLDNNLLSYAHDGSETADDSFDLSFTNGIESVNDVVAVTVMPQNDAPMVTENNGAVVDEGESVQISLAALDARDPENDSLTFSLTALPNNGALRRDGLALNMNSSFTPAEIGAGQISYLHDGSETTTDSLALTLSDGDGDVPFSFAISVTPQNDSPEMTVDDVLEGDEGEIAVLPASILSASDDDGDALEYVVKQLPQNGTLLKNGIALGIGDSFAPTDLAAGEIGYLHDGSETFEDSFGLAASDGMVETAVQTVSVFIFAVNDAPVVVGETAVLTVDESATIDLAVLASDAEGDPLTFNILTQPNNGMVTIDASGVATYTPDVGFVGMDIFTFEANDGDESSAPATITLTVNDVEKLLFLPFVVRGE